MADNPLMQVAFRVPFDRIEARHVVPAIDALLERAREQLAEIGRRGDQDSPPPSYDETLGALEAATEPVAFATGLVAHLEAVRTTPELRAAYNEARPKVSAFFAGIPLDPALYAALQRFSKTDEAAGLDPVRRRFLDKTLEELRREGAELDDEGKASLREIDVALSKATMAFAEHVLDATSAFELVVDDEARLEGLPAAAKEAARESAAAKGLDRGWRFTLQEPSLIAVLTYADDRGLRETLWRAHSTRATRGDQDNRRLIQEILDLRRRKASLLGYRDFADLVLEDRMAKSGARAETFVQDLAERTRPFFERETAELADFHRELLGPDAGPLAPWDVAWVSEKLRKARYDLDEEELRAYFPADAVLDGLFETVKRLYGLSIEADPDLPGWHPDVRAYRLSDERGRHLGSFYADLHPRDDKRGGAWMNPLLSGGPGEPHLGLFCANVNGPVGGRPALLSHREVETLFHEFGHLMHHLLSEVPVKSLSGTSVAWDFVELPSQIMENWTWEKAALDTFARHWQTGAPIPDELFRKMQGARTFRAASSQMRQLGFAALDLALHRRYDPERDGDVMDFTREILQAHAPTPLPEDYGMVASFSHLFASPVGYAAGYYSYKWAEVLDADAFTRFADAGVFDQDVGRAFRDEILSQGNSDDPARLFERFMGRPPELGSLLAREGLVGDSGAPAA
ncbi:MAG TPA: M3 family metallopeptidase [Polyangiaceae bacterium LLY-WYZ-14_1]|nr:M3 family metallopeptidase [Polyangiaceae bacterium LLY-WYZ-14_1]